MTRIPIEELLLQRHEMLLIDELLSFSRDHVEVSVTVADNQPFVDPMQGMPAWVGIELMAQAVSVFSGLELREQGLKPRIGLLLGTRSFETRVAFFGIGAHLQVRAVLALRDASGLGVFDCTIHQGGRLLAQAQVKGYMPEDLDSLLGSER